MSGLVALQGGREFGANCRDLDMEVLRRTPMGPIVVLAGAARTGHAYATAARNGARYLGNLSGDPAVAAPDPREDLDGCLAALGQAQLVMLPGGSPTELLHVLTELGDGAVGAAVRQRHEAGATVNGASAGAMVLCARTWLPDGDGSITDGLGLVPGIALPHHAPDRADRTGAPDDLPRWGLPECGGVLVDDEGVRAVGAGDPVLLHHGMVTVLPRDTVRPLP